MECSGVKEIKDFRLEKGEYMRVDVKRGEESRVKGMK